MPSTKTNNGWKTCSRGHKFRGKACPICWKGNKARKIEDELVVAKMRKISEEIKNGKYKVFTHARVKEKYGFK